jgi:outer membrane protein TolC
MRAGALGIASGIGSLLLATNLTAQRPDSAPVRPAVAPADSTVTRIAPPPAGTLRLADVYAEAARSSPRVEAARALARAAAARVPSARRPPDPQLQVGFMNYGLPGLRPMETLGMNQLQLMQMLPVAGQLGLAGASAEARAEAERARAVDVQWDVRTRAATAFYELYQYDQSIAIAGETRRLMQDIARIAEAMYKVGEGRQADVLRAQVEVARMTEEIVRMQAMRTATAGRLNAILDRPADTPVPTALLPAFAANAPSLDSLHAAAQAGRPMIRAGEQEVRAARASERLARRDIWPDLQLGVQYGQRDATGGMGGTERMGSLMIGASVPVFARSRQLKMREETAAMQQMAAADLGAMRADTRGAVAEMYADLARSRNLQALYRTTILPQAEANVTSSLAAYRVGSIPFMTLIDSRAAVNRYRQELVALEADEGRAWAELEMLLGAELFDPSRTASPNAARRSEP